MVCSGTRHDSPPERSREIPLRTRPQQALAVASPCHRVVRTGGALSGYRWGVARKRTLLDREASR
nr:MGMT family protein [Chondromyces apiculatus]